MLLNIDDNFKEKFNVYHAVNEGGHFRSKRLHSV